MINTTITVTYRHGRVAHSRAGYGISITPEPLRDQGKSYQVTALRIPYGMGWKKDTDIVSICNLNEKSVRIPGGVYTPNGIDADTEKADAEESSRLGFIMFLKGGIFLGSSPSLEVQERLKVRGGELIFLRAKYPGTAIRWFCLATKSTWKKTTSKTYFEVEESSHHLGGYIIRGGWGEQQWDHIQSHAIV